MRGAELRIPDAYFLYEEEFGRLCNDADGISFATLLPDLINTSLHVEGRLWLIIVLTLDDFLEAANGFFS